MEAVDWHALIEDRLAQADAQRSALLVAIEEMRKARQLTFSDDEHDPDGSTVALDQARDAALLDRVETTVTEFAAARERLADGSFGRCERCGRRIPEARLEARPEARRCVACAGRSPR
jgi:RNA polymerase-binding transcription factor DksA